MTVIKTSHIKVSTMFRKRCVMLAKLIVTLSFCAWLITKSDWDSLYQIFSQCKPSAVAVVFGFMLLSLSLSAYKWRILLGIHEISISVVESHHYYLVGTFLNNFLPSNIGGDGYRIYKTMYKSESKISAVIAVIMERVTGVVALLLLGYAGALVSFHFNGHPISMNAVIVGTLGIISVLAIWLLLHTNTIKWLNLIRQIPKSFRAVLTYGADYHRHTYKLAWVGGLSILFHVESLAMYWFLFYAMGAVTNPWELAVAVTVASIAGMLPISINGIGVVDGVFIFMMTQYGLQYEIVLSTMILMRSMIMVFSLLGGLIYLKGNRNRIDSSTLAQNTSVST